MASVHQFVGAPDTTGEGGDTPRLPVEVINLTWVFTHYVTSWAFEEGEWLPLLTRLSFRKGLNGQPEDGDTTMPEAHCAKKGGQVIKPGSPKLGMFKNYRTKIPAYKSDTGTPGDYFGTMWDRWSVVGRKPRNKFDFKGFRDFRSHLVDNGVIEPITRQVAETIIETMEANVSNLKIQPNSPARAERIAAFEKQIEAMSASLDSIEEIFEEEEKVAPTPKASVRTRKLGKPAVEES